MDLDNDGGVCNAILYDRVTKVFILNPGCKKISNRGIRILQTKLGEIIQCRCALCPRSDWMIMYLSKLFVCHQICTMGEGRLVSPPSVDTGLRVAWARSGILSKGMKFPGRKFGPILTSGIFYMLYQLDFDSHVIQTILLSTVWVSDSAWFAVDRNTQHQALHDSFHRWPYSIDLIYVSLKISRKKQWFSTVEEDCCLGLQWIWTELV